jgi:hypothetical protein
MTNQELTNLRVQLYKPTPLRLKLVDELISEIKSCFGDKVETTTIEFKHHFFKLGGMWVKSVQTEEKGIGGVLVHWEANPRISTTTDPFCSAYILSTNEVKSLLQTVKSVKAIYASSHKK